jgi:Ras-related protein Rab-2A
MAIRRSLPADPDDAAATFKFILLGDSSVGKSCIISKFRDDQCRASHDVTVGVSFTNQVMRIGSSVLTVQIWDTAGQEIYRAITRRYYRDSHCAIIVCDLSNALTFESMAEWVKEVRVLAPESCKIMLVGNKVDLPRQVSPDDFDAFAQTVGCPAVETSAVTGVNIRRLFEDCAIAAYADRAGKEQVQNETPTSPRSVESREEINEGCC